MTPGHTTIAAIAMLLALTAQAEPSDNHLVLHGVSYHTIPRTRGPEWNQTNPGIGLRHEFTQTLSGQIGVYKNSFYRQSIYAGVDWTPLRLGDIHFGGFGGVASGYADKAGLAGGGVVRWQGQKLSLTLRIVPAKCAIYTLELGYRF